MDVDLGLASPRHDFALCRITLDYDIFFLPPPPPPPLSCNKKKKLHSEVSINVFLFCFLDFGGSSNIKSIKILPDYYSYILKLLALND